MSRETTMSMSESLRLHVQRITKLPTLPEIAQNILSLVDDEMASAARLEKVIEKDPAISAKLLSVANSAFFGFQTSTTTLSSAIVRIGFNNVKNIALGISLMTVLNSEKHVRVLDYMRVFNHSVAVGFIAKLFSQKIKLRIAEEMLMNGMLHDIGFLVLSRYFPDTYSNVLQALSGEKTLLEAEEEVFGFTHSDIGRWLAEKWVLPDSVIDTIFYHHSPSLAKTNTGHVAVVHIADLFTTKNILTVTKKDPEYPYDAACLDTLNISESEMADIEMQMKDELLTNGPFQF